MRYITSEQFLQADKEVQRALLDWWKPMKGDLIEYQCNELGKILAIDNESYVDMNNGYLGNVVPLFTLQQLMEYVEEETCGDSDRGIGYARNKKEAYNLLKEDYTKEYIIKFINENWIGGM